MQSRPFKSPVRHTIAALLWYSTLTELSYAEYFVGFARFWGRFCCKTSATVSDVIVYPAPECLARDLSNRID